MKQGWGGSIRLRGCFAARDWCTAQNRWHHEEAKLCGYIEATYQDISQEVKSLVVNGSSKWPTTPDATFQSCGKMV